MPQSIPYDSVWGGNVTEAMAEVERIGEANPTGVALTFGDFFFGVFLFFRSVGEAVIFPARIINVAFADMVGAGLIDSAFVSLIGGTFTLMCYMVYTVAVIQLISGRKVEGYQ